LNFLFVTYESITRLCGKILVAWGAIREYSVRNYWKLPPCPIEPMPAGSKTDLFLAKAKPVSNGGSASVNVFKEGEKSHR